MNVLHHIVLTVPLAVLVCLGGCKKPSTQGEQHIVCIHSYDDSGQEGKYFRELMDDSFREHLVNADVTHIYLDLLSDEQLGSTPYGGINDFISYIRTLKPKVILINDDLALEFMFNNCDTLLKTYPSVFAGVSAPRPYDKDLYPLLAGITDRVDLAVNCELVSKLSGSISAYVELDYGGYQDRLRQILKENVSDTIRFICSEITAETPAPDSDSRTTIHKHFAVNLISAEQAEITELPYAQNQIQVKYDVLSNEFIDSGMRPQFTCIREQFGNEGRRNDKKSRTRFLCGYFADIRTQIDDQVEYAADILGGAEPYSLPSLNHKKDFYMDWLAMNKYDRPLTYRECEKSFKIINAPFIISHHDLFVAGIIVCSLLLVSLSAFLSTIIFKRKKRQKKEELDVLRAEIDKRMLALENLETGFFMIKDHTIKFFFGFAEKQGFVKDSLSVNGIKSFIHPSSVGLVERLLLKPEELEKHNKMRIRLDFDGEGWRWWMLNMDTIGDDNHSFIGSLVNIDNIVEMESAAWDAAVKAEEVLSKENFIANITHDIRTPLNAITGFSELLLDPDNTPEDKAEYMDIISANTDQLINLLEEATVVQSDDTDAISFNYSIIDFSKLADNSYKTNKILCPKQLKLIYERGEGEGIMVNCDHVRTSQVINNFLSNAFKYTPSGTVTLGWRVLSESNRVELYVRDTGVGISEEDKKVVGERFGMAKGNRKGTGLGLDICQKIIASQKGIYGFESELGKGSCFHFSLPITNNRKN